MSEAKQPNLLTINVNEHTEKKGQLTYLSWAWAWAEVLKVDPKATWTVHTYGPQGSEQPCMWIGETAMVHTSVTVNGLRRECMLPVMDNRNNAMKNPDSRKISDAIMRCMTKTISMHGLGLYIYAGEDLPEGDEPPDTDKKPEPAPRLRHSPTDGPVDVEPDRRTLIELAASLSAELFKAGEKDDAFDKIADFLKDNEEMLYLQQLLKPYSTFRAYIKFRQEQAAKRARQEEPA